MSLEIKEQAKKVVRLASTPFQELGDLTSVLSKEINQLASKDIGSVVQSITKLVEERVKENPYTAIATTAGLGFALGHLKLPELKLAAIRFSKLVALRAISTIEQKQEHSAHAAPPKAELEHKEEKKNAS